MGDTVTHGVLKMGRAVGKKKLTLYFRKVMSFQMLKDVFPGVFVREHVCVFVHVCMLIFTGHGCIVVVSFTTQFTKTAAWLS